MAALGSNRSIDGGLNGGPQRAQCGIVDHFLARGEHELQRCGVDDLNPGGPRLRSIHFFDRLQSTHSLYPVTLYAPLIPDFISAPTSAASSPHPFLSSFSTLLQSFLYT